MGSSSPFISIKPITSEADLPRCAHLADIALKPDGLHEFKARYGSKSLYDETLDALTDALHDEKQRFRLFKAVVPASSASAQVDRVVQNGAEEEIIVGFAHYRYGYVDFPKMDPFAPRDQLEDPSKVTEVPEITAVAAANADENVLPADIATTIGDIKGAESQKPMPFYTDPTKELSRKLGNAYISSIRGKRHVYLHRLIVDPACQRQGIGQKLLDWGIETADRENIVAWLFCRPAGFKLYEKNGWKIVQSIDFDPPDNDLVIAPVLAMIRSPGRRGA